MKETPFHQRTRRLNRNQMWFNWDLCVVPDVYDDFHAELRATRERVSMGDMSPLSKYVVAGSQAPALLDRLMTRDIASIDVGQVVYTPWCDDRGKVVGDGLVFRLEGNRYLITGDPHLAWFSRHAEGLDVVVTDVTDDSGLLAVQGPRSQELMTALTGGDWDDLPFSRFRTIDIGGARIDVARQGFTGEHGYELRVPTSAALDVWDAVAAAGEPFGIVPVGEYAIDVARVEAGLLIVGADYTGAGPDRRGSTIETITDNEASPYEIGLGSFVQLDKAADFIGKQALLEEAGGDHGSHLVGLELDWASLVALADKHGVPPLIPSRVWWYPLEVSDGGVVVGRATSVTWAPTVNALIGFGHVAAGSAAHGRELSVRWTLGGLNVEVSAHVIEMPFLTLRRS